MKNKTYLATIAGRTFTRESHRTYTKAIALVHRETGDVRAVRFTAATKPTNHYAGTLEPIDRYMSYQQRQAADAYNAEQRKIWEPVTVDAVAVEVERFTQAQADMLKSIGMSVLSGLPCGYVGVAGTQATVKSLIERGLLSDYEGDGPLWGAGQQVVPAGKFADLVNELRDWQYGECFSYLDGLNAKYNPDADLWALRTVALYCKIERGML